MAVNDVEWERGLTALCAFVATRNPRRIPARAIANGIPVGEWAAARREQYWAGQLQPGRVADLEAVRGWDWDGPARRRWENALRRLERYVEMHGLAQPPPHARIAKFAVGAWVDAQRAAKAAGTLPDRLACRLERLPGWTWETAGDRWTVGLQALRAYIAEHDAIDDIPREAQQAGFPVGHWVQRCREEQRAGTLSSAQVAALEEIPGWRWSATIDRWDRAMAAVRRYVAAQGHASPAQAEVIGGFAIGMWVHNRRQERRRGILPESRTEQLERLDGWTWTGADAPWQRRFAALSRHVSVHGSMPGPDVVSGGTPLLDWAERQRRAYRLGRLPPYHAARLETLPGWSWTRPSRT